MEKQFDIGDTVYFAVGKMPSNQSVFPGKVMDRVCDTKGNFTYLIFCGGDRGYKWESDVYETREEVVEQILKYI